MTRKEQKEERKKQILFTTLNLFVTKGYYDTKITDIAEAASMSTGLLFHYFESKEDLLLELVKMGADSTKSVSQAEADNPDKYFEGFLNMLFEYANKQPWVFQMFVLMGQARRVGMPEDVRKIALSVDMISNSAKLIEQGQKAGCFKDGDPKLLATCFWTAVQGIMEEMAFDKGMSAPNPEWIMAILRK